jgi:nitrite reductase (NO-forming)
MSTRLFCILAIALLVSIVACSQEGAEQVDTAELNGEIDEAPAVDPADPTTITLEQRIQNGGALYRQHCIACHQANGQGLPGAFPPLAGSDQLQKGPSIVINAIVNGLSGPITVNGVEYNAVMPPLPYLSEGQVADVVTFVMNSWNNPGGEVSAADVADFRAGGAE